MTVDLKTLSLANLASLYNIIADKPIAKFKDKATGVEKLSKLLESRMEEVFVCSNEGEEPIEYDIRPIDAMDEVKMDEPVGSVVPAEEAKKTGEKRGRKSGLLGKTLTLVREANPKREKSATRIRYEIYRLAECKTSDDFMRICTEQGLGSRREILSDLDYDSKQQFIKLG